MGASTKRKIRANRCIACGGTGRSSRGNECLPCHSTGRQLIYRCTNCHLFTSKPVTRYKNGTLTRSCPHCPGNVEKYG